MKRLEEMSLTELWKLFPIILVPHNPVWADWAREEISQLKELLAIPYASYHHIGSTAVPGIWAKPIVDIIVELPGREALVAAKRRLISAGYLLMSESASRASLNKGYTPEGYAKRVFHIHLRQSGDADEVAFRDYLNSHPDVAKDYEALKLSLWKPFEHERDGYTAAKTDFVTRYTAIAKLDSDKKTD
ncbi:MAG: GrpB family protein [Muribaculaceae bacterium]|nr:GrpB family protein [Muribaculaceae bacterium]